MKFNKGHDYDYKMLRPSQISVDPLYQREVETHRVAKIVKEFNGDIFNAPKVSFRDGKYWVFDGQHSIAVWKMLHDNEDVPLECKVFRGMTWLDEAEAFILQNGIAKDPTTNEKLRTAYNTKNPDVVDMVNKAKLCGFVVDFVVSKTPTRIVATSALFKAYKALGAQAYTEMLTAIRDAWYGDQDAISAQIIKAMAIFFRTYYGNFDPNDLAQSLRKITPIQIIREGKQYNNRKNTYTMEILKCYNVRRRKNRLDETKL